MAEGAVFRAAEAGDDEGDGVWGGGGGILGGGGGVKGFEVGEIFLGDGFVVGEFEQTAPRHVGDGDMAAESFAGPALVSEELSEIADRENHRLREVGG